MAGRHRHNVYIVWLTPNTKVCEASKTESGQASARGAAPKPRELSWEQLEVGARGQLRDHAAVEAMHLLPRDQVRAQPHFTESPLNSPPPANIRYAVPYECRRWS